MISTQKTTWLLAIIHLLLLGESYGFSVRQSQSLGGCQDMTLCNLLSQRQLHVAQHRVSTQLFSILNESDKDGDSTVDFQDFNPLSYKSKGVSSLGYSGTQISLRKTQMRELVNELLNLDGDQSATQKVLDQYKDFLLEPLNDSEAVLDVDSIYTPGMTRAQRFDTYRSSMEERLSKVEYVQVRQVLEAMRDFVLSNE